MSDKELNGLRYSHKYKGVERKILWPRPPPRFMTSRNTVTAGLARRIEHKAGNGVGVKTVSIK